MVRRSRKSRKNRKKPRENKRFARLYAASTGAFPVSNISSDRKTDEKKSAVSPLFTEAILYGSPCGAQQTDHAAFLPEKPSWYYIWGCSIDNSGGIRPAQPNMIIIQADGRFVKNPVDGTRRNADTAIPERRRLRTVRF